MKSLCVVSMLALVALVSACATNDALTPADIPPDVQSVLDANAANANANRAQATAGAARSTAAAASALGTSIAHNTSVAATATYAAQTAVVNAALTADHRTEVAKTEAANARSTDIALTHEQQTADAHASETAIALRHEQETAAAHVSETAQAHAHETATWVAEAPTRVALAAAMANEEQQKQFDQEIAVKRQEWALMVAPFIGAAQVLFGQLWLPFLVTGLILIMLFGLWQVKNAGLRAIDAHTEEKTSVALAKRVVFTNGVPTGFVTVDEYGNWHIQTINPQPSIEMSGPAIPPVVLRDTRDAKQLAPPDPQVLNDFIHYTSLRAFVAAILDTDDWTQSRWADKELPRGFVLSKDTKDERGNIVYGGYARVMELLVTKNLIIGRKRGAAGQWNPHAPREVEQVMDILFNKRPAPPLPETVPANSPAAPSTVAQPTI